jgi:hypothetical protein
MPELDRFERNLTAAVRAFADRADSRVDPMAVAQQAIGRRRFAPFMWFGRPLPIPAAVILLLALLVALLAWTLQVGGRPDSQLSVVPATADTVSASSTPSPRPSTDGVGDEYVSGSGSFVIVDPGSSSTLGNATLVRGYVATSVDSMNDPRVTGTGTLRLSLDEHGTFGAEWGTYRLENDGGAWEGLVNGAAWNRGESSDVTGWLVGSGSYEGFTYFIDVRISGLQTELSGVIYPGSAGTLITGHIDMWYLMRICSAVALVASWPSAAPVRALRRRPQRPSTRDHAHARGQRAPGEADGDSDPVYGQEGPEYVVGTSSVAVTKSGSKQSSVTSQLRGQEMADGGTMNVRGSPERRRSPERRHLRVGRVNGDDADRECRGAGMAPGPEHRGTMAGPRRGGWLVGGEPTRAGPSTSTRTARGSHSTSGIIFEAAPE